MIKLPLQYQSGRTLLAELDPEHYITDKKRVVSKLTAENQWAKPVLAIPATQSLELSDSEYASLMSDWNKFQAYLKRNVQKHLQGQHDQSTHAGKKSYKSIDDLVKDGLDLQSAVEEIGMSGAADGNVEMRVLLERMGKGGKPEIVASIKDLDGEPMYRGAAEKTNNNFKNEDYDRIGTGQYGDGYYFSSYEGTANEYALRAAQDRTYGRNQPDVMVAGWKKDAKVFTAGTGKDASLQWIDKATAAQNNAIDKLNINTRASDDQDAIFNMFYSDYGNSLVTDLILQGYDGMTIGVGLSEVYTVVFNREALQVVSN